MAHYRSIQSLRFLAAIAVVIFHLSDGHFTTGAAGVDVFFVISGFIMGTVGVSESPKTFIVKRLARIVPLYWAATLAMCVLALGGLFSHFTFDGVRLLKSLLFIPFFSGETTIWPLLVQGWTLNYEMLFYFVFALGLVLRAPIAFTAVALFVLVACGLAFRPHAAPLQIWTDPILLEFLAGFAFATFVRPAGLGKGSAMMALGLAGFALVGWFSAFDSSFRLLTWGLPAALVVCGALAIERAGAWPVMKPVEAGGDASYSLYLLHGFAVTLGHRVIGTSLVANLVIVFLAILASWLCYRLFERPVARFLVTLVGSKRRNSADHAIARKERQETPVEALPASLV